MDPKQKKKLFTAMYIGMILIVIATCVFLYFFLQSHATQCLADPIQYYSERTNQLCYCNSGMGWIKP